MEAKKMITNRNTINICDIDWEPDFEIEACPECEDLSFTVTAGELSDAEGWVECDLCGHSRVPVKDNQVWSDMVTSYLNTFKSFHPYQTTRRVMVSEGWLAEINHHQPGYYLYKVYEYSEMRFVEAGIISLLPG